MPKKILISDDAMFMRTMLRKILETNGYEVCGEATNGQEAVDKYIEHSPDLVLMDITMPVLDGISAVKAIKAKDPNCKIIMCTAMGQKEMVFEAIRSGAKDFIVKPFQAPRVLQSVEKILGAA
ncbi:MAG: response regulator [Capsulimonadaceae bacterium]|nr:response regulator [Capsulimonadaceae bacterium]